MSSPSATLLSVNNYYYPRGGAETVFLGHNRMFEEAGWKVVPFAMQHPKNLPSEWSGWFVDELEFGSDYSLTEKLRRVPKVIYSTEARRRIRALIERVSPDICHGHNIYHHLSPSILGVLRDQGIPTVLTLHDLKLACPAYSMLSNGVICERCRGGRIHNVLVRRCIKQSLTMSAIVFAEAAVHRMLDSYSACVQRFIVPSRFYITKFVEWGFDAARFVHVPNFVDVAKFRPDFSPGARFVYVGRLSPEKGLATLVRAVARAGVAADLIGTGPQEAELKELAAGTGADVKFHGHQGGDRLHSLVRAARALVLPSEWYENAPMTVLEAYALGKPVVGADIGGIPELVTSGRTGLSFASGNVDALASALSTMRGTPDHAVEAMGREARELVCSNFSADPYRERVLQVYRTISDQRALVS